MKHSARNLISKNVEIVQITTPGPHDSLCPQCTTRVRTTCQFFAGVNIGEPGESMYAPVCAGCVAESYPSLGSAIKALNTAASRLERLEWRHAKQAMGAMQIIAKRVASVAGPTDRRAEDEIAKDLYRAFLAVVSKHCYDATEIAAADLIGDVNLFDLVDLLGSYIADRIKAAGDVEGWLSKAGRDIEGGGQL